MTGWWILIGTQQSSELRFGARAQPAISAGMVARGIARRVGNFCHGTPCDGRCQRHRNRSRVEEYAPVLEHRGDLNFAAELRDDRSQHLEGQTYFAVFYLRHR
jgi:hypothetical protein